MSSKVFSTVTAAEAPYVDVIDVHVYSESPNSAALKQIHDELGLPVLMSEFGFRSMVM